MDIDKAFTNRANLSTAQLENLLQHLQEDLRRYKEACKNYSPEHYKKYATPMIETFLGKIGKVQRLVAERSNAGVCKTPQP